MQELHITSKKSEKTSTEIKVTSPQVSQKRSASRNSSIVLTQEENHIDDTSDDASLDQSIFRTLSTTKPLTLIPNPKNHAINNIAKPESFIPNQLGPSKNNQRVESIKEARHKYRKEALGKKF